MHPLTPPAARLLSCILCLAFALVYAISHLGFPGDSAWTSLKIVALGWFLFCADDWAELVLRGKRPPFLPLFALAFAIVAGMLLPALFPLMAVVGTVGFVRCLLACRREIPTYRWWFAVYATLFSIGIIARFWGIGSHFPLILERVPFSGFRPDALFFSAGAKIFETYGVVTTGVDGLVPMTYHMAGHLALLQLSHLIGVPLVDFYIIGYPAIFLPLFFYTLITFSLEYRNLAGSPTSDRAQALPRLYWLTLLVVIFGLLPYPLRVNISANISWGALFASESYTFGLILQLVFFASLCQRWKHPGLAESSRFWLVVVPAFILALTLTKVSAAFITLAVVGYLVLRGGWYRHPKVVGGYSIALVLFLFTLLRIAIPEDTAVRFELFSIPRHLPEPMRTLFFPVFFFWSLVTITCLALSRGVRTRGDLVRAFREKSLLDAEALLVCCVVGTLPLLVLRLPHHNVLYFASDQLYLGLGLLLGFVADKRLPATMASWWARPRVKFSSGLAGIVILYLLLDGTLSPLRRLAGELIGHRATVVGLPREAVEGLKGNPFHWDTSRQDLWKRLVFGPSEALARNPTFQILGQLRALDALTLEEKRRTALFIPQRNLAYWGVPQCFSPAFTAQALSGLAMLDGMPRVGCTTSHFGFHYFPPRTLAGLQDEDLCARAAAKGFTRVIRLDFEKSTSRLSTETCSSN